MSSVAERVLAALSGRGQTLATAESLTGGLIGGVLSSVPGASAVYLGGAITYATRLKATLAGVAEATLARHGAVAPETAIEMAAGVAARCRADWGLAVTGVAGPDPAEGHPVGMVFVAVACPELSFSRVRELALSGNRREIREATVLAALEELDRALRSDADGMKPVAGGVA